MSSPTQERSQSRGRDAFSTGRGGVGNIRQTSLSRTRAELGSSPTPDVSVVRGREPVPAANSTTKIYSTGRGGAGNIRSPSRDPSKPPAPTLIDASQQEIIRNHIAVSQEVPVRVMLSSFDLLIFCFLSSFPFFVLSSRLDVVELEISILDLDLVVPHSPPAQTLTSVQTLLPILITVQILIFKVLISVLFVKTVAVGLKMIQIC